MLKTPAIPAGFFIGGYVFSLNENNHFKFTKNNRKDV